ncbi:TPA: hypothetical protein MFB39_000772 [Klebsiella pneumoniae]|uniref:tail fiber/spike domain-containing protein n=1 Tax=Klebsiella pneumoniae TaxID=573 RepID=UPI0025A0A310|nr:hypothetical protein [Klebsiella pneumoniae]MDM7427942.1 hypothetical protein [Klebsiella pneumoniae]HBU8487320.1 hypothetical protein [Klebsiella pneumoniae]HBW4786356.1 hypothetical protein [Klebsiella pneumoniae]HBW5338587.1 hypothetical protein [Klebsiella pneumoniae]HBW5415264.1 hypothetical protein [Klebsiella pneumoniae]
MTRLPESSSWEEEIELISRSERVAGGLDGPANRPLKSLANRTRYLKDQADTAGELIAEKVSAVKTFAEGATLESPREEILFDSYRLVWTGEFPKTVLAGSTPQGTGGIGAGCWAYTSDAVIRQNLGSNETGLGASLIGVVGGLTVQQKFDNTAEISILDYIPAKIQSHLSSASDALAYAGDLREYIIAALADAVAQRKTLVFPSGNYPVSAPIQQPVGAMVRGTGLSTMIIAMDGFEAGTWIWSWPANTGQPRYITRDMCFDGRGQYVGGFLENTGCHTSIIDGIFVRNCWGGGIRIYPQYVSGTGRDIVNLGVTRCYVLDSGSSSSDYFPAVSVRVDTSGGNWTDGQMTGIDISVTDGDTENDAGPMAFSIEAVGKVIFNVDFHRFFTSSRMNTHIKINATNADGGINNLRIVNCKFSQFSGETHNYIGISGSGNVDLPQIDLLSAGSWCTFDNLYAHGALNNAGLKITSGYKPLFTNMTFQPGQNRDNDGNYLSALNIVACDYAVFRDCDIRNLISTSYDAPWKTALTKYMTDNGRGTVWESSQMTGNPVVQRSMDYYSSLTLKSGSTTLYYPTNAYSYGPDIIFTAGDNNSLVISYPVTANETDDENFRYSFLVDTSGTVKYYYLTSRFTMTAGDVGNHYLAFQMWGNRYVVSPDKLNSEVTITQRFTAGDVSSSLAQLIVHIGHTAASSTKPSFKLSDMILTTDRFVYTKNYRKIAQVI